MLLGLSATPAAAYEVRIGVANVQTRDQAWNGFDGGTADGVFNVGPWSFAHGLEARAAIPWKKVDFTFGGRLSLHEGSLNGVAASLMLAEPEFGMRRRFRVRPWADVYGQALLSVPYARMTFDGAQQDHSYWAVFPMVTPGVGATVYPLLRNQRDIGFSAEIGYSTPAPLAFRARNGIDPGTLNYGGLSYGIFLVYRSDSPPIRRAAAPVAKPSTEPEPIGPTE